MARHRLLFLVDSKDVTAQDLVAQSWRWVFFCAFTRESSTLQSLSSTAALNCAVVTKSMVHGPDWPH